MYFDTNLLKFVPSGPIGLGNGFVPSGNKLFPEITLTENYYPISLGVIARG